MLRRRVCARRGGKAGSMNGQIQKTIYCRFWDLASSGARLLTIQSLRRAVPAWREAISGCAIDARPECNKERGYFSSAENHGGAGMDKSKFLGRSGIGAYRAWSADTNPAGAAARLQPVRNYLVSAGLRHRKTRCKAGMLPDARLWGRWWRIRCQTNGNKSGQVAQSEKIEIGIPATGRCVRKTSRHGTNSETGKLKMSNFVPPRYKTHHFSAWHRPATGHLYRFTICTNPEGGNHA